jgi:hypothetical protein
MASFSFRSLPLPASAEMAQDVLGGRSRPPHFADVMKLFGHDFFVKVEKVHAFPGLYQSASE